MSPTLSAVLHAAERHQGLACFDTAEHETIVTWGESEPHTEVHTWQAFVRENLRVTQEIGDRYSGGVVGWLGYESGAAVERMPAPVGPRRTHDVCLWRTDGAIVRDHHTGRWRVHGTGSFREAAEHLLARASISTEGTPRQKANPKTGLPNPSRPARYQDSVRRVLDHVRAGDVYQVSLAWEHEPIVVGSGLQTWLKLRRQNPALRGCYLRIGGTEILSNSPELFLELDPQTRTVRSIPIKGTAPVSEGSDSRTRLEESAKERAELTMIVDLVRNDLGRIATPGSVIAHPRTIRQCGDLWHAEQLVEARVVDSLDAVDVVSSTFPPGSVTGAPKVRAMQVIAELEDGPRGVYTGAIGWFANNGGAHLNVAIRTATVQDGQASFHVGAGIVADSDPQAEWDETLAKAKALKEALHP